MPESLPHVPVAEIPTPASTDLTDANNTYPLLTEIVTTDSVGPQAANQQPKALDKRTESIRERVNQLIDIVNAMSANFLHRDGTSKLSNNTADPSFMRGDLDMTDPTAGTGGPYKIVNMADGVAAQDGVSKTQLDALQALVDALQASLGTDFLLRNGTLSMTANLNLGGNQIENLGAAVNPNDALRKTEFDTTVAALQAAHVRRDGGNTMQGDLDMGGHKIIGILTTAFPVLDSDVATKKYVDDTFGSIASIAAGTIVPFAGSTVPSGWILCVTEDTEVQLADGSVRPIGEIVDEKQEVEVVGIDSEGNLATGRVIGWMAADASVDDWLRLSTAHGKGVGPRALTLTKNHPVWTQRGWVRADELDESSDVVFRRSTTLTDVGRAALIGRFLGDSHLEPTGRLCLSQSSVHGDYQRFCNDKVGVNTAEYTHENPWHRDGVSDSVHGKVSLSTFDPVLLGKLRAGVTAELLDEMGDVGLAFWLMDDGSLHLDKKSSWASFRFHTCSESEEERQILRDWLWDRYGATTTLHELSHTDGSVIAVSAEGTRRIAKRIARYVHPSMRYKLPEAFRDTAFDLETAPWVEVGTVPWRFTIQPVAEMSRTERYCRNHRRRLDIKVDGIRSFVANGFVVHNCDGRPLDTTTFSALFSVIQYEYGGSGTTFNVPDLRGRVLAGMDNYDNIPIVTTPPGTAGAANRLDNFGNSSDLNGTFGSEDHTLTTPELPSHTHSYDDAYMATGSGGSLQGVASPDSVDTLVNVSPQPSTDAAGGGSAHNNVQPCMVMAFMIKT